MTFMSVVHPVESVPTSIFGVTTIIFSVDDGGTYRAPGGHGTKQWKATATHAMLFVFAKMVYKTLYKNIGDTIISLMRPN